MNALNYTTYKLTLREYFIFGMVGILSALLISYLFYHSLIPCLVTIFFAKKYFRFISESLKEYREKKLCIQFKDSIISMAASLETGSSIENAIWDAYLEISIIHSKDCYMSIELMSIYNQIKMNIPVELAFSSLAARTDAADIKTFCDILSIAKRTGGNLVHIIKDTSGTIEEKTAILREIDTNIKGKKFEQLILSLMPLFIIIYISITTPGFFDSIYHNIFGIIFSTACLILYIVSFIISSKMSRIEV